MFTDAHSIAQTGGASLRAFLDTNQNGKFDLEDWDNSESQPLFPMLHVKDAYYSVKVGPGGSSLTLAKVEPKMGTLETGMPDATLAVVGECGIQRLTGGDGKYPVPAANVAETLFGPSMVSVQVGALPLQAPDQPVK